MKRCALIAGIFPAAFFATLLSAQEPAPSPPPDQTLAQAAAADIPSRPVPASEFLFNGSLDLGYRWLSGPAGSFQTYRSVVNLGAGPKLMGLELSITNPSRKFFDDASLSAHDWGGDPYSTLRLDVRKSRVYRLNGDYRGISYFNNLPSYADPLLAPGVTLDEQSFDTHRRLSSLNLEIFPSRALTPYVSAERDAGSGTGVTVFHSDNNDYPVSGTMRDSTNLFRAGVRMSVWRVNGSVEEGYTNFRNDQIDSLNSVNYGNSQAPVFGQTLDLTGLQQDYGIRGRSYYTKAAASSSLFPWLDVYGQYTYTAPRNTVNYSQGDRGNLVLLNQLLFFSGEQYLVNAAASFPHTTATAGWEMRPWRRLRILQSWLTDRTTNTGSAQQNDTLTSAGLITARTAAALASTLSVNFSQADTTLIFDAGHGFTLRGGYRYVWGMGNDLVTPAEGLLTVTGKRLQRNVGMGTVSWRPGANVTLSGDAEVGRSGGTYFRTSLYNYQKVRAMARYRFWKYWDLSGDFRVLTNQNPLAGSSYHYLARQESATLTWTPTAKKISAAATWEHCTYQSSVGYLIPQLLTAAASVYREDCHRISGLISAGVPGIHKHSITLEAGGAAVLTSGSRPTTDYQPSAKFTAPISAKVAAFGEWRYYGFGELFYQYESFRAHLITLGVRLTR